VSTAAIAIEAMPGRPWLRMRWTILVQMPGTSMGSWSSTAGASTSWTSRAQAPLP
jgi:hypothetical protein